MPLAKLDITIDQGYEWQALLIQSGRELSQASLQGQMRRSPNDPDVLAVFRFGARTYDTDKDESQVLVSISQFDTKEIPETGGGAWVYDLRAILSSGIAILLLSGNVRVNLTVSKY